MVLGSVQITDLKGFSPLDLTWGRPIVAISGPNGSGKSALLNAVFATISVDIESTSASIAGRLEGGQLKATVSREGVESDISVNFRGAGQIDREGEADERLFLIETGSQVPKIQEFFRNSHDIDDLIGSYAPRALSAGELRDLSYVTQKAYKTVEVTEIDDLENNLGIRHPFIFVRMEDQFGQYDTRTASHGELSAIYVYWALKRVAAGSVIFIEEPETFISERSQSELIDVVAKLCHDRYLTVVLSTHSSRILRRLEEGEVCFLYPSNEGVRVAAVTHHHSMMSDGGHAERIARVALTEDFLGARLLRMLFEHFKPNLLSKIEVCGRGGKEALNRVREGLPSDIQGLLFAYVYDGDVRTEFPEAVPADVHFLPGSGSPEQEIRAFALSHRDAIAAAFGTNGDAVGGAFASVGGVDPHDWIEEFGRELGCNPDRSFELLVKTWLTDEDNRASSQSLVTGLARHFGVP